MVMGLEYAFPSKYYFHLHTLYVRIQIRKSINEKPTFHAEKCQMLLNGKQTASKA
jgi:hypothetical protein